MLVEFVRRIFSGGSYTILASICLASIDVSWHREKCDCELLRHFGGWQMSGRLRERVLAEGASGRLARKRSYRLVMLVVVGGERNRIMNYEFNSLKYLESK